MPDKPISLFRSWTLQQENIPKLINSPLSWAWRKELVKIGNNIFYFRGSVSLSIRGRLQSQLSPLCVSCYKLTCVKIYLKSHIFILGRKQQHIEAREKEKKPLPVLFYSSTCEHLHSPNCSDIPEREAFTSMDFYFFSLVAKWETSCPSRRQKPSAMF